MAKNKIQEETGVSQQNTNAISSSASLSSQRQPSRPGTKESGSTSPLPPQQATSMAGKNDSTSLSCSQTTDEPARKETSLSRSLPTQRPPHREATQARHTSEPLSRPRPPGARTIGSSQSSNSTAGIRLQSSSGLGRGRDTNLPALTTRDTLKEGIKTQTGINGDRCSALLRSPETSSLGGDRNINPAALMTKDEPKANSDACFSGDKRPSPSERENRSSYTSASRERENYSVYPSGSYRSVRPA
jgi:hypothetical protein